MCGIVGYVGPKQASPILIEGLRRMEYRGYDSAGVAVINGDGIKVRKTAGKLAALVENLQTEAPQGTIGVGHTRWATHGAPTTPNAHPHLDRSGRIARIPNGLIEHAARPPHAAPAPPSSTTASSKTPPASGRPWRSAATSSSRIPTRKCWPI